MKFILSAFVAALVGTNVVSAVSLAQKDSAISQALAQTQVEIESEA